MKMFLTVLVVSKNNSCFHIFSFTDEFIFYIDDDDFCFF